MSVALLVGAGAATAASGPPATSESVALAAPPDLPDCTEPAPFSDVPITHPFCPEIKWMKDNGISTGFPDGSYKPAANVTRQAMSAFLARLAGSVPVACTTPPFTDVATNHPFCKEIQWMKDNAISTGFANGTYQPASNVTRQAMSAFLAREAGATPALCVAGNPPFSDVAVDHPFCKEIKWMKDNGISTGFSDGTYQPAANVTRQAMSAFLYRVSFLVGKVPVVTVSIGSAGYVEDGPVVTIDGGLTVTDVDDANLTSARISINAGREAADVLALSSAPAAGITATYDSTTGVLTLTGSQTVANYQAALRTVTFANNNDPVSTSRTIAFKVKDNALWSDVKTRQVLVAANNDAPTPDNETFAASNSAVGNTALVVNDPTDGAPAVADPKKSISGDLLDGDTDVDGPGPLTITPGTFATANGGLVTIEADGDFTYVSDPADVCAPNSDSFTYTLNDNGSPNRTANGTVTIGLAGCVWYVRNNAPANGGGTSLAPFDTLAEAQAASQPLHTIFVFDGDNTTTGYNAGISLKNNQRLLSEMVNLTMPSSEHAGVTLWTATANRPTITDSNADVIELASANEVRGFEINPAGTGGGLAGSGAFDTSGTIADIRIVDTGTAGQQPMLELNTTAGTWNISDLFINNTGATSPPNTATGVLLVNAGIVNFVPASAITIVTTVSPGLDAQGTNMGTSTFDAISVSSATNGGIRLLNNTGTTALGDGVGTDVNVNTASGAAAAILLSAAGSVTVGAAGTDNVSSNGGPAISVVSGSGVSELSFESVTSTGSASDGISLSGLTTGTFSSVSGSITGAGGTAFLVAGGSGAITYPGNIGDGAGTSVSVSARTGGTVSLTGSINDGPDTGGGVVLSSNTSGSTVFSHSAKTLNTAASAGVLFSNSDGHTLTITGGGLDIDTTSGPGILASNSGTLIITGATNSIATGSGTALSVTNTDIGAGGLNFVSISCNGAPSGIVLANTGSAGGLIVTGTGASTSGTAGTIAASLGTGGTIQGTTGDAISLTGVAGGATLKNMIIGDATVTAANAPDTIVNGAGDGISIVNSNNIVLENLKIGRPGANGIEGTGVTNFSMLNTAVLNAGTGALEDGLNFGGSNTNELGGTLAISNSIVSNSWANNMYISNHSGTLTGTITGTTFGTNSNSGDGNDSVNVESLGTASLNLTFSNPTFTGARGDLLGANFQGNGGNSLTVTSGAFSNNHPGIATGGGGISLFEGSSSAPTTINLTSSTFRDAVGHAILIVKSLAPGNVNNPSSVLNVNISGITVGIDGVANSGSLEGSGLKIQHAGGGGTLDVNITGSSAIRQYNNFGMELQTGAGVVTSGTAHFDITGNLIEDPGNNPNVTGFQGVALNSGVTPGDTFQSCLHLKNNIVVGAGSPDLPADDIRVRARQNTTVRLPGYAGNLTDLTAIATFLRNQNDANGNDPAANAPVPSGSATRDAGASYTGTGTSCTP